MVENFNEIVNNQSFEIKQEFKLIRGKDFSKEKIYSQDVAVFMLSGLTFLDCDFIDVDSIYTTFLNCDFTNCSFTETIFFKSKQ